MNRRGQMLITPAIILLIVMMAFLPSLVRWTQHDARSAVKTIQNTRALEMAEAAVDMGFQKLIESSTTWNGVLNGVIPAGFKFNLVYNDIGIGTYAVRLSSGPGPQQATIVGVGRDKFRKEIWAVRQVVQNAVSQTALYTVFGSTVSNNAQVQWGPIVSYGPLSTDGAHTFPRLYGTGAIAPMDVGALIPNNDNVQWWAFYGLLPPPPQIDLDGYEALAKAGGAGHYNVGSPPYTVAGGAMNGTYFYDGDTILDPANPMYLNGNLIVRGNLTIQGNVGTGSLAAAVPESAWHEYGNSWAYYRSTWDPAAPGSFPGQSANYVPAGLPSMPLTNLVVHGFVYVEKQLIINDMAGVQVPVHGAMYIGAHSNLSPAQTAFTLYFDPVVARGVLTRNVPLARQQWQNLSTCAWTGVNPTCPL